MGRAKEKLKGPWGPGEGIVKDTGKGGLNPDDARLLLKYFGLLPEEE